MKKKFTYRDKLIELAQIYGVKEIQDYIRRRKNLTTGQLELILKKNKIIIPKDFKTNFFKENFSKPLSKIKSDLYDLKDGSFKAVNKVSRKIGNLKSNTSQEIIYNLKRLWHGMANVGLSFLNVIPKLGKTTYHYIANLLTELFNSIYNQKINSTKMNGMTL